jgi:hypothetical protein
MVFYFNFLFSNPKNVRPFVCQDGVKSKKGQNREENKTAIFTLLLPTGFCTYCNDYPVHFRNSSPVNTDLRTAGSAMRSAILSASFYIINCDTVHCVKLRIVQKRVHLFFIF